MWKMLGIAIVTLACSFATSSASAQPTAPATSAATSLPEIGETVALEAGQRAPWVGMLVRDVDLFELQSQALSLRLQMTNARDLLSEAIAGRARLLEQAGETCQERVDLYSSLWRARVDELRFALDESRRREGPEWYEHPTLWFAVGALIAGGLAVGVSAAVR